MNLTENTRLMKNQTFGVEIEMSGISDYEMIKTIAKYFNTDGIINRTRYDHDGSTLRGYECRDNNNRKWLIVGDGSINYSQTNSNVNGGCGEMVTPVLKYEDIETLQAVVRALRERGAVSSYKYGCGVHIHVGADVTTDGGQTPKSLRNLANIMASHEKILVKAINTNRNRLNYCAYSDENFINELNRKKPRTLADLQRIWYESQGYTNLRCASGNHYNSSRYHMLNYHNIFLKLLANEPQKCTIEFRLFEFHKNMHCGELRAYIQLCLAMSNYAKMVAFSSPTPINMDNEKYAMKNWLNNLGMIGDEFKTARKMLTKRLSGDTAYRRVRVSGVNDLDDLDLSE